MPKLTITLTDAPVFTADAVVLAWTATDGEKTDTFTADASLTDSLPDRKRDAIACLAVIDAVQAFVKQETSAAFAAHRAAVKRHKAQLDAAVAADNGDEVLRLMSAKPEKPENPDGIDERMEPFASFLTAASAAWTGAKRHTFTAREGKDVIWTGTLGSVVAKRPRSGRIAAGLVNVR